MTFYGLGGADLNLRAQLALRGLTDNPLSDIAALLSSAHPIEDRTRKLLAQAMESAPDAAISIKLTIHPSSQFVRAFRLRLIRFWIGREVEKLGPVLGYKQAVLDVQERCQTIDIKSIEAAVTFNRKFWKWAELIRTERSDGSELSNRELEAAYIYADIKRIRPEHAIRGSLRLMAEIVRDYERDLQSSTGILEPWQLAQRRGARRT